MAVDQLARLAGLNRPTPVASLGALPGRRAVYRRAGASYERLLGPSLLLIVSLRDVEPVPGLLASLMSIADEIGDLNASVVLLKDASEDDDLSAALNDQLPGLAGRIRVLLLNTAGAPGAVGSANHGLRMALELGADALILDPGVALSPGALTELAAVATLDPLTSVVSPRSNNAAICNSPYPDRFRAIGRDEAARAHLDLAEYLGRLTYTPTVAGGCLYIRHAMLREFGLLDKAYGDRDAGLADFIIRCNQRGYRSILANWAYAYDASDGAAPTSIAPATPETLLAYREVTERYAEYPRSLRRFFNGVDYRAQSLMAGLLTIGGEKRRILFDCRYLGRHYNGTAEHTIKLMTAFVAGHREAYDLFVACDQEALVFHGLDKLEGLSWCGGDELSMGPFAAVFRCAQPFGIDDLVTLSDLAAVTVFLMLDTIAMDCQNLDEQGLEYIWRQMLEIADVVGFNSSFTQAQFERRFLCGRSIHRFVSLCSTDWLEYIGPSNPAEVSSGGNILLFGNHYSHKHVRETLAALNQTPDRPPVICFGLEVPADERTVSVKTGDLSVEAVEALYASAGVVLFPSHYEGFGLPIMHALAHRKPVVARRLPVFEEIRRRTPRGNNIILCDTTEQMARIASMLPAWREDEEACAEPVQTWAMAADALAAAIASALDRVTHAGLIRKLERVETCRSLLRAGVVHPGEFAAPLER